MKTIHQPFNKTRVTSWYGDDKGYIDGYVTKPLNRYSNEHTTYAIVIWDRGTASEVKLDDLNFPSNENS